MVTDRLLARAALRLADDGDSHTYRSAAVERFSATLLLLWGKLRDGDITHAEYRQQVQAAFQRAVGTVPPDAQAKVQDLEAQALQQAMSLTETDDRVEEDQPSPAQRGSWTNAVAGLAWAASTVATVYRQADSDEDTVTWQCEDDESSCDDCTTLDGQTWRVADIPQWPGDGGTQCLGNCRCTLE